MTDYKKLMSVKLKLITLCKCFCLTALFLCACSELPDHCGDNNKFNSSTHFCFNDETIAKCGGNDYDPPTEFCSGGAVMDKCGGTEYSPVTQFCYGDTTVTKCGGNDYDPPTQRCVGDTIVKRCHDGSSVPLGSACVVYTLTTTISAGNGTILVNDVASAGITSHDSGTTVNVKAEPAVGYTFTGWSGASSSTNTTVPVTMDGNKELVANFRLIPTYTLTVNPNTTAGGTVTPASPQTGITAGTQVTVTATENFGYRFTNWTVATGNATFGNANNATTTVSLSSNATIRANFELICYTLTINRNPTAGGTVTPSPANSAGCPSGTYTVGASVTVTQTSNTGYRFTGWVGAATGTSNSVTVIMNSDLTLTANYIRQFTLTISRNMTNGGTVLVNNVSYTVPTTHDSGAVVNITATPSNVHGFWKWLGVNSHSAASTVTMHSDQSITANFKGGYFNQAISYGSFIDPRDGQSYRIIHINGRTWMAENINYNIPLSTANVCNNNDENNCAKYGRLYYWFEAKNYACPDGWRFSTGDDWGTLVNFAGGPDVAGKKLKAKTGWPSGGNGTDDYGFSAVPGGLDNSEAGEGGYWWTDEEYGNDTERAYRRGMGSGDGMWRNHEGRGRKHSVRCVRN